LSGRDTANIPKVKKSAAMSSSAGASARLGSVPCTTTNYTIKASEKDGDCANQGQVRLRSLSDMGIYQQSSQCILDALQFPATTPTRSNGQLNRYKTFLFLCVAMAVIAVRANPQVGILPKNDVALKETTDEKFRVGDVWEYHTRKGEKHSRITILKVDESPELGTIVHTGVDKVRLSNCH
jgi:hypothetical protein